MSALVVWIVSLTNNIINGYNAYTCSPLQRSGHGLPAPIPGIYMYITNLSNVSVC